MIYFVCEQGNLKLQLQHLSVHGIAKRSLRRAGIFWRRRNSAWRLNRTASWGGGGEVGDISSSISKSIFKETSQLLLSLSGR